MNPRNRLDRRVYVRRGTGERIIPQCFELTLKHGDGRFKTVAVLRLMQKNCSTLWFGLCGALTQLLEDQKTKESGLSWTFLHSHLTSSSFITYRDTWRLRKPSAWWDNRSPCSQTMKYFLLLPLCSFSISKPSTSFAKTRFYSWHFKSQKSDIAADCLWFLVISVYKNQLAETLLRWVIHHFCSILFLLSKILKSQLHNGALRSFKINLYSTRQ